MKYMLLKSIILFCFVLTSVHAYSAGKTPQWVLFGTTENFDSYYNKVDVVRHQDGPILVTIKYVYTDKYARETAIKYKINTPIKFSHQLHGYDCSMNAFRIIRGIDYSGDYSQINSTEFDVRFSTPLQGSIAETLMGILCSSKEKIPLLQLTPKKQIEKKSFSPNKQSQDPVIDKYN